MEPSKRIGILPNVYLTYIQSDKFKTDYMSITLLRPLRREEAALNSLLPEVLFQGTERYPDMQSIADHLNDLYGASVQSMSRRKGEVQMIGLFGNCVDDAWAPDGGVLEPLIDFLGQMLLHPALEDGAFRSDYVTVEQQNLIRAIEARINNKRSYAGRRLQEIMFEDEAYGIDRMGTVETVQEITPEGLYRHYQTVLARSRIELFFLGRAEEEAVTRWVRDALRDLPREDPDPVGTVVVRRAELAREVTETMDVTQGQLIMGLRTDCVGEDPLYPALVLCNAVLGGTVSSKLFQNVREKMSLCYYAGSGLDRTKGVMTISSGIAFEHYEIAKAAILRQLEDCKIGNITEDEMESARSYILSTLNMAKDSPGRQEALYVGRATTGTAETFEEQIAQIKRVTVEDVCAAAQRLTLDTVYFMKGENADDAV